MISNSLIIDVRHQQRALAVIVSITINYRVITSCKKGWCKSPPMGDPKGDTKRRPLPLLEYQLKNYFYGGGAFLLFFSLLGPFFHVCVPLSLLFFSLWDAFFSMYGRFFVPIGVFLGSPLTKFRRAPMSLPPPPPPPHPILPHLENCIYL